MAYWQTKIKRGNANSNQKHDMNEWINDNKLWNNVKDTFARDWFHKKILARNF